MSDRALLDRIWDLWNTGRRAEIPAAVEEAGDAQKTLTAYLSLQRDLYWGKRSLEAALAVSRWGLAYSRRLAVRDAENVLLYNVASFTLPWWSDSLDATAGQRADGRESARSVLALRGRMGKGPADLSTAHWAVGAHALVAGDRAEAIRHFDAGVLESRKAGDKNLEASALEGLARTRILLAPADRAWGLETLREAQALYFEVRDEANLKESERWEARLLASSEKI